MKKYLTPTDLQSALSLRDLSDPAAGPHAMQEIVAAGRDPRTTDLRSIAEEPNYTIPSDLPLDEAFHFLEEHDLERVPVVEKGKLVGVLSRAVLQRRLAEDEPPSELEE